MNKIRKGDEVVALVGKDRGRRGSVSAVLANGRVIVGGLNLVKKAQKGDPNSGVPGGIVDKEMSMDVSNVALWNAAKDDGKGGADRIGFRWVGEGDAKHKVRYFKSTQDVLDH
ncbi:MAG TPA: 50S ribosomal protein L24 [Nevskiaceae bacterium]|nr:50S ribosomal protein L24 [Nevskiaceae bacterium]